MWQKQQGLDGRAALVGRQVVQEDALRHAGLHGGRARRLVHLDGEAGRRAHAVGRRQDPVAPGKHVRLCGWVSRAILS